MFRGYWTLVIMNGYEAASAIKRLAGDNYIPIIFITALDSTDALTNSLASGGDDFISKPFDVEVLKSKIIAHLRIRDLNQQLNAKNEQLYSANQYLTHEQDLIEHFFSSALEQSYLDERFIKYHMSSMSTFNGDIFLVARSPQGGLNIILGDFTGHGLSAAMGTLPVVMIFFKMVSLNAAVSDIAREINLQLYKLLPVSMFFSANILELNAQGNILTAWAGGMPEAYWIDQKGLLKGSVKSKHMPLGILHDGGFDSGTDVISVNDGDKFYLYSDGITESHKSNGEMFGGERLKNILISPVKDRIRTVLTEINHFTEDEGQSDDVTLVELSCHCFLLDENNESETIIHDSSLSWKISIVLLCSDIQKKQPLEKIFEILGALPVLQKHKDVIATLLSEIYFNALDYSLLGMNEISRNIPEQFENYYKIREERIRNLTNATIEFNLGYSETEGKRQLSIQIKDNGKGYKGHISESSSERLHGYGLEIVSNLCERVAFSEDGRILELLYRL